MRLILKRFYAQIMHRMKQSLQRFKYNIERYIVRAWQRRGLWFFLTYGLSLIWRLALMCRSRTSHRLPVPVIVIGNIVVGGAGKTPLTLACVKALTQRGWRPAIVSRGYGRMTEGIRMIDRAHDTAQTVGDEPLLLALRTECPIVVGQDRYQAAQTLLAQYPETNLIILDDGLQHIRLARDIEIAVFDQRGIGNGACLPAGLLREPVSRLQTVSMVVGNGIAGSKLPLPAIPFYNMLLAANGWRHLQTGQEWPQIPDLLRKNRPKIAAVAGIANPQRFFDTLHQLDLNFSEHPFPDHYAFSAADFEQISAEIILMTEKDAVKCQAFADVRMWVLIVDAQFDSALIDDIDRRLRGSALV